jgi:hypothetical protein
MIETKSPGCGVMIIGRTTLRMTTDAKSPINGPAAKTTRRRLGFHAPRTRPIAVPRIRFGTRKTRMIINGR